MERLHIRPRELNLYESIRLGRKKSSRLRVIDPMTGRPLPDAGQKVVQSSYWVRRLRCGDIEEVKAAPRTRAKPRSTQKE